MIKRYFWIVVLVAGAHLSWGFALLGPLTLANGADAWQTAVIGYDLAYAGSTTSGDPVFLGDVGGPRNIFEEYRRNVPVLYYTYDQSFSKYFSTDGMAAVDSAFALMNTVPSANTTDLSLFPDQTLQYNYTAQADFLTDLKSVTLHLLVEQLGLADPERFVWTLHDRVLLPGTTCPVGQVYTVVQRNYEDDQNFSADNIYSLYINDTLYTYLIVEICTGPNPLALAVPFSPDPEANLYTSVAANNFDGSGLFLLGSGSGVQPRQTSGGLQVGSFYTGLTRDDVAGLRYLYTTNEVNYEVPDPTALWFSVTTNFSQQALFPSVTSTNNTGTNGGFYTFDGTYGYGDYGFLVATSITNSPVVLQALYPGLVIASSSNYFGYITNWIFTQYVTNAGYGSTYPPPQILVTVSNPVVSLQQKFLTTFANVFTNNVSPTTTYQLQTITVTNLVGAPFGSAPVTNTTVQTITRNVPSGDFFVFTLFHTNICPIDFLYTGLTNLLAVTNILTTTNLLTSTSGTTGTSNIFSSTVIQINYVATNQWVVHPVNCAEVSNAASLYQGIGGVKFQRADYDSGLSQYLVPITNYYTMVVLTNSQWQLRHFVRVVTQPDIVLTASDQGLPNTFIGTARRSTPNFIPSPNLGNLAGPGTIASPSDLDYDKIGDSVWNGYDVQIIGAATTNIFLGQYGSIPALAWASFGASTNAPELYPNGTSLQNLEYQLVIQLTPSGPPNGTVGAAYSQQFSASGGAFSPPFTWSAFGYAVGSGILSGLPPGLTMSSTGLLSGTPTTPGTYDFVLQLTDALGRSVQWNLSITIN